MNKYFATIWLCILAFASYAQPTELSLDGNWQVTGYNPDKSKKININGKVPGQVHVDLLNAKLIPDPFWRKNADDCQWVEHWEWTYKKQFIVPENYPTEWVQLQFDGLDTYADIFINGRKLGKVGEPTANNMFIPYKFDIQEYLKYGKENIIEVKFYPLEKIVGEWAKKKTLPTAFADPLRPYVRRMQCTFGWDWVHRFITMGIWRGCRLIAYNNAKINSVYAYTKQLQNNNANLHIQVEHHIKNKAAEQVNVQVKSPNGTVLYNQTQPIQENNVNVFTPVINNPQLWWPAGYGSQPIYKVVTNLLAKNNTVVDVKTVETGIRTITLEQLPDSNTVGASSFTLMVNGKRIFAKGGNWIPADPFPSRITNNQYEYLLQQAKDAGMNMLRVWGGGIYEPDIFWQLCNRMGIMASQDFMLACGDYPVDNKEFVNSLKTEFTENIIAIRNHPSLVLWFGDNELALGKKPTDDWFCKKIHTELTQKLAADLDPSRPFRLTSPLGNDPNTTNSLISGDAHQSALHSKEIEEENFKNYRQAIVKYASPRFLTKSVSAGSPNKQALLKFMNEADLANSEIFDYHTKDNPYVKGGLSLFGKLEHLAEGLYGNPGKNVNRRIAQLEYVQHEFVRLSMEACRANKFYSSGILFWMYNDCWPASGWSLIDYWGGRKAGWFGMASGCKPVIAATRATKDSTHWFITSDVEGNNEMLTVSVFKQLFNGSKQSLFQKIIQQPNNISEQVFSMSNAAIQNSLTNNEMLVCEVRKGNELIDRSFYTHFLPKDVNYGKTKLTIKQQNKATSGVITIQSTNWARVVTLASSNDIDFEDNYFEMLPGETKQIKWKAKTAVTKPITVSCWNQ